MIIYIKLHQKFVFLNHYSRNLVLFNFRGDNARVFQRVSTNLLMTVGQGACQLLCRYLKHTGCVLHLLNRTDCYVVTLSKELVAVHVWNAPDQWHNWRVAGARTAPCQATCKNLVPT